MLSARGRRVVVAVAALVVGALTFRLGLWQLDRAEQKTSLQRAIDERALMPMLDTAALARTPEQAQAQFHRTVRLTGRWLPAATVYLDNRQMNGRPGFFVITPLQLADGSAVVVQRGWQPRDALDRSRVADTPTPSGSVELTGRVAPPPARLYEFQAPTAERIRQNLDLEAYARETGLTLRPLSVWQTGTASDGLERDWLPPAIDVARHHGYAFQWFALSALVAGLYVWFQLVRPWRQGSRRGG
ncbi:SURF1 family protein [Aquincola tertiaricarbonis]|uniref:SURF1 family protein n=1 Tax=Aquincola tertiaricarbonis TaxID=391953 RepID=UPI0006153EE6|nr:SURF1 family protein [Aquincola tertiaricarbonis]